MKLLVFPFLSLQCSEVNLLEGLLTLVLGVWVMMVKDPWILELQIVALGKMLSESGCTLTQKIQGN